MHDNPYSTPRSAVEDIEPVDISVIEAPVEVIQYPWLSIWTRPRATIRYLVATQPVRHVSLLAAITGFAQNLSSIDERYLIRDLGPMQLVLYAALLAPVSGWLGLYLGAAVMRWTGSWLGGRASAQNLRCAIAWAGIPMIPIIACFFIQLALLGNETFLSEPASLSESTPLWLLYYSLEWVKLGLSLWCGLIMIKGLAQVHGFSAWRAVGSFLLSSVLVLFGVIALTVAIIIPFVFLQGLFTY